MNLTGLIRARNAERWIAESVRALLACCQNVVVMDDHSTDRTLPILDSIPEVIWARSPFETLNEARDKTVLVATAKYLLTVHNKPAPDWFVMLDADEVLLDPCPLLANLKSDRAPAYSLRFLTLWDRPTQIRVDGIYGNLWRGSVFKLSETAGVWEQKSPDGPNLHCGSVPTDLANKVVQCDPPVWIKHYGSMEKADRLRKYAWYLEHDTQHQHAEDGYRHAVQGDLPEFPAKAIYRHGGPLRLEELRLVKGTA